MCVLGVVCGLLQTESFHCAARGDLFSSMMIVFSGSVIPQGESGQRFFLSLSLSFLITKEVIFFCRQKVSA